MTAGHLGGMQMAHKPFNRGLNVLLKNAGAGLSIAMLASLPGVAHADESGISFWVPGFFGSLAATPQQPGWSLATIYYHTSVSAGADVARAREFTLGRVPANLTVNANLNLSVNATGNLGFVIPSYVFATPVLGGMVSSLAHVLLVTPVIFYWLRERELRRAEANKEDRSW